METTKTSNFTCQSKSFVSICFTCQVSARGLQPFSGHGLANDIHSQTAITGYSTNTILILVNLFIFATLFLVIVLCAERFIAIHYCFRYQELVTHKRVVAVVVSIWVLSGLFSLVRLWIPTSIMYVVFGITQLACIVAATFFSIRIYSSVRLHVNQIQVLQLQHAPQNAQMVNVRRMRKFAIMSV